MKQKVFDILDSLEIPYTNYEHEAVHSCDDAKWIEVPGVRCKSLLLRNKKATQFYMVVLPDYKRLDPNLIRAIYDDTKMSFASEQRMMEKIWLRPGSVSPFALINNADNDIRVVFDSELKDVEIGFHPLQNDNTIVTQMKYVEHFLENIGNEFIFSEL